MGSQRPEVLDRVALFERLGDDRKLFDEISGLFLEDCPRLLSKIRGAVSSRDAPALEQAAHTLKGCVANFSAAAAYEAALRLEKMARARQLKGAASACTALELEIERFQEALNALARELAQR